MNTSKTSHTIQVYGIPNCETVKKARVWLTEQQKAYDFHDFKKIGVPTQALASWINAVGWEKLLNRKGTTWRKLDADIQAGAVDATSASNLMVAYPSVIKRPVVVWGNGAVTVGFDAETFKQASAA